MPDKCSVTRVQSLHAVFFARVLGCARILPANEKKVSKFVSFLDRIILGLQGCVRNSFFQNVTLAHLARGAWYLFQLKKSLLIYNFCISGEPGALIYKLKLTGWMHQDEITKWWFFIETMIGLLLRLAVRSFLRFLTTLPFAFRSAKEEKPWTRPSTNQAPRNCRDRELRPSHRLRH